MSSSIPEAHSTESTLSILQTDRHGRRNFSMLLIDYTGYFAGITFISASTILPLFVHQLTTSNILVGLIPAIFILGMSLPSPLLARFIEHLPRKRNYILWCATFERLPWLALPLLTLSIGHSSPTLLLVLFFFFWTIHASSLGCGIPAYVDLVRKIIPVNWRGRLYGLGGGMGGVLSLPGAWFAQRFLDRYGFPAGFAYCFLTTFFILTVSVAFITLVKEPPNPVSSVTPTWQGYIGRAKAILKMNRPFVFFNLSQILYAFNGMAAAFYTVYAIARINAQPGDVALFTGVLMGTNIIAYPLWGYLADHHGNRRVMVWAIICGLASPVVALSSGSLYSFALVFALHGFARTGLDLAGFNIVMEFSPAGEAPTYVALNRFLTAPLLALAPLLGGVIADRWGYIPVFYLATAGTVVSLFLLLRMREPRDTCAQQTKTVSTHRS